jgi:amino acid transporter
MPRAGGSYVYASRALNPYLGFVASFSQWFGLSIAIGVVSYVLIPFLRDIAAALGWQMLAGTLNASGVRLTLALVFLWTFVAVNLRGVQLYERTLVPLMFLMFALGAIVIVGTFYMLFTAAVYHAVPWTYIAEEAMKRDLTAPGLLGYLLPAGWTVAIVSGAAAALTNDLPAMILAVSRLMFAWAEDGIFPRRVASVHPKWHTPHVAIGLSGFMATVGILGSHLAGDFFLGVDILVTSMLVNFLLMCVSVLMLPRRNPPLAREVRVLPSRRVQMPVALFGTVVLSGFLAVHIWKDFNAPVGAWYFHSTLVWLIVMAVATGIYWRELRNLRRSGVDVDAIFSTLPPD